MCLAEDDVLRAGVRVLVAGGASGMAFLRKDQGLPCAGQQLLTAGSNRPTAGQS